MTQGEEFYISTVTLSQTFKKVKSEYNIPYAEELAERFGGDVDFDAAHELKRISLVQRHRIDNMVRNEEEKQQTGNGDYFNPRIKFEIDTLANLLKQFNTMMKSPLDAANERSAAEAMLSAVDDSDSVNEKLAGFLEENILNGELTNEALQDFMASL